MLGLGFMEVIGVLLLMLVLFGPKELPRLARQVARLIYEMKNIFHRLEKEWDLENISKKPLQKTSQKEELPQKAPPVKKPQDNES